MALTDILQARGANLPAPQMNPANTLQFQRFGPNIQSALDQLLQMGLAGTQQNVQQGFEPIRERATSEFEKRTIPSIAERFTSMGGQRSGAFKQSLSQAGADLQERLAGLEGQYNLQRQGQLQNLLQLGLTPRYENIYTGREPGIFESLAQPTLQGLGLGIPMALLGGLSGFGGLGAAGSGVQALLSLLLGSR